MSYYEHNDLIITGENSSIKKLYDRIVFDKKETNAKDRYLWQIITELINFDVFDPASSYNYWDIRFLTNYTCSNKIVDYLVAEFLDLTLEFKYRDINVGVHGRSIYQYGKVVFKEEFRLFDDRFDNRYNILFDEMCL